VSTPGPYRGILPFRLCDSGVFFGRERAATDLTAKILVHRLVVLFGLSGSGKSSLLNAGVFPLLLREGMQPERLRVRPLADEPLLIERVPTGRDEAQFLPSLFTPPAGEGAEPAALPCSLQRFEQLLFDRPQSVPPVLVFDQFEELFTLFDARHRELQARILDTLHRLAAAPQPVAKVVIGIREDFLGALEVMARRYPQVFDQRIRLQLLDQESARRAITAPFEGEHGFPSAIAPDLADTIVRDLLAKEDQPGVDSTQLQIVCSRLWDEHAGRQAQIGLAEYSALDGIEGILGRFLEAEMRQLPLVQRRQAYAVLGHLITRAGTRDVVSEHRLRDLLRDQGDLDEPNLAAALAFLEEHRLIHRTPQRGTYYCEVASEYLIGSIQQDRARRERIRELEARIVDPGGAAEERTEEGTALCLSGGGYRAMLFHLGVLWRLNELGFLPRLAQVSAVSTGAVVAGLLGVNWRRLEFDASGVARNFKAQMADPLLHLAGHTVDVATALLGLLNPLGKGRVPKPMREALATLYGDAGLQDFPAQPRIVVCATNLDTESQWRFSRSAMGDHRTGMVREPNIEVAVAVGASLAMPPLPAVEVEAPGLAGRALLIDGSVYDMLALESAWRRYDVLLISDGTSRDAGTRPVSSAEGFLESFARTMDLIAAQSHRVMRRQVVDLFALGARRGAYWSLRTDFSAYEVPNVLAVRPETVGELASLPARLRGLPEDVQQRLVNLGYAVADAAMRRRMVADAAPGNWPFPAASM